MIGGLKTKVCDRHMDFKVHYWDFLVRCPVCEWIGDEENMQSTIDMLKKEMTDLDESVWFLERKAGMLESQVEDFQGAADELENECRGMEKRGLKRFFIEISDLRTTVCYNYGCNHWYLCLKAKSDYREGTDSSMKDCEGYKKESEASYREFRID
jgi:hypothetical protein